MKAILTAGMIGWLAAAEMMAGPAGMELRLGSGEKSPGHYQEYNYNAAILGDLTQLASFDAAYPGAIPQGSALRERIEQQRQKFQKASAQSRAFGVAVGLMTDEASLPIPVLERMGNSSSENNLSTRIDFDSEKFWEAYRAKYREVLKAYPQVAYVIVRTGENYSHPDEGYIGRTVRDGDIDDAYFRHMQRLIEETRKIVVDEFGRTLIWRTWDLGGDGFHADPKVYDRVLAGLTNRKGLIFAIKFTQTDFWRYNDFNPTIGRGGVNQIVEFQCAREYEGKGAFPDYVGPIHAAALRQAAALGVKGVWIWDFGGGWGGPFLQSDRWARLNIFATSRLAQNPDLSPRALAEEWAAKEFGPKSATNVAEMLMLSGECVRKCMYIEAFARDHGGWKPSLNLMRDDIIRGEVLEQLYEGSKNSLPAVFAEKDEAAALAARMRTLFENSRSDIVAERGEREYQESLSSLIYLENLTQVLDHYVKGMFSFYQWQETREAAPAAQAQQELLAWRASWRRYQTDVPKLPGVATIYHSQNRTQNPTDKSQSRGAMAELCEAALKSLADKTADHASAQTTGNSVTYASQTKIK
jgi:hypothetical protein